jgi:transcriptional regulator with XRE-family HTH domain
VDGQAVPDTFIEIAARLAAGRGWTLDKLALEAHDGATKGASYALIRKAFSGQRAVTTRVMQAVADALNVPPETFAEYQLAQARQLLDEREVGLAQAYENLQRLGLAATPPDADEARRRAARERLPAIPPAPELPAPERSAPSERREPRAQGSTRDGSPGRRRSA